ARPYARPARARRPRSRAPAAPARPPCPAGRGSPPWGESGPAPSEALPRDALVGLDVFRPRLLDHVRRQLRRRRLFVPALGGRPVAHVLLVEGRRRLARLPGIGGPEARGVRGHHLVAEDHPGTRG